MTNKKSLIDNYTLTKNSKIYLAGHTGLVGSAILKKLKQDGYTNVVYRTHSELELTDQQAVANFFKSEKPDIVILAAAKVGGIMANNIYRGDFIYSNLMVQTNVIHQAYLHNVQKLLFLGSTCVYPKKAKQPISEESLLTSSLEYTNEPYAIAKIAGIKLCESYNIQYGTNFMSVMPTNLYGVNDNFDLENSHVLPALIRKIHLGKALDSDNWTALRKDLNYLPIQHVDGDASNSEILDILSCYGISKDEKQNQTQIEIWGSGKPRREFMYSEDMADACVFLIKNKNFSDLYNLNEKEIKNTHINIGTGVDISIKELAITIKKIIGYNGEIYFNTNKPDGTMIKRTDTSKLKSYGWEYKVKIEEGIGNIYDWYINR